MAALCLASASEARAAVIDFQYGTNLTPTPIAPLGVPHTSMSLHSVAPFPDPSAGPVGDASGVGTDIVVGSVTIKDISLPPHTYTDAYLKLITVDVAVKDDASGVIKDFVFMGTLSGTVKLTGGTSGQTNITFTEITAPITQVLGTNLYTVSFVNFQNPGIIPGTGGVTLAGNMTDHIVAQPVVPEPSTMALAGIGSLGLIGVAIRRRRRQA